MAEVIFSSSFDDKHTTENILNPDKKLFWTSTGLFPQELFIQLQSEKQLASVSISAYGIKKLSIESCENDSAVNFVKQGETSDLPHKEGKLHDFSVNLKGGKPTKILRVIIQEGHEDFCSIHHIGFK